MNINPIHSQADLTAALTWIEYLWGRKSDRLRVTSWKYGAADRKI